MDEQGRNRKELHGDIPDHPPNRFSSWEEQLLIEADNEAPFEVQINNYQRNADQRLWVSFQATASAIAQLYRERVQEQETGWELFQNAATSATSLYRETSEVTRTTRDLATQCGYQRRNKEIIAWLRKRKRNIRREDILSFICGRSPPHRSGPLIRSVKQSPHPKSEHQDHDLQQFHEAVSLQGLSGAMAGISVCSHPGSSSSPRSRRSPPALGETANLTSEDSRRRSDPSPTSSSKIHSELLSSRKRNPSSESSNSDCPVSKRART